MVALDEARVVEAIPVTEADELAEGMAKAFVEGQAQKEQVSPEEVKPTFRERIAALRERYADNPEMLDQVDNVERMLKERRSAENAARSAQVKKRKAQKQARRKNR